MAFEPNRSPTGQPYRAEPIAWPQKRICTDSWWTQAKPEGFTAQCEQRIYSDRGKDVLPISGAIGSRSWENSL